MMMKLFYSGWRSLFFALALSAFLAFPASAAGMSGETAGVTEQQDTVAAASCAATPASSASAQEIASASSASAQDTASASSASRSLQSLGVFTTSGYCCCSHCTRGSNLTYAGTVPQANYTISADLSVLPLGTRVQINGVIYTVEDKGSGVNGREIDIFYPDHNTALAHGRQQQEVFLVL